MTSPFVNHDQSLAALRPRQPRVLVFDSGVGGLSVAQEIQKLLPDAALIYASDNGFFPYGTKDEEALITRVDKVVRALMQHYAPDLLVVACNTASTLTLPHLRSYLTIPVVGVVPAVKPAAQLTRSRVVGLLATPATIARPYTEALIREHAPSCDVIRVGSSELVQLAEKKLRGEALDNALLIAVTNQLKAHKLFSQMDVLILACTHFPLLKTELAELLPDGVQLIDSGDAIARRVKFLIESLPMSASQEYERNGSIAVFTREDTGIEKLKPALLPFGIKQIDYLALG